MFQSCKYALRLLGPLMESEALNDKFQRHLKENVVLHYGEFMNDLAKLIVSIIIHEYLIILCVL